MWQSLSRVFTINQANSVSGSEIGSEISEFKIPISKEESLLDFPTNLSEILKQAQDGQKLDLGAMVFNSREDLMDIKLFENSEDRPASVDDGIPDVAGNCI